MATLFSRILDRDEKTGLRLIARGHGVALQGVLASVILNASGQLFFKAAHTAHPDASALSVLFYYQTWIGFLLYSLSALCWLWVLARAHLSFAYPILSLAFPIVVGLSAAFFGETVPLIRWAGVGVIVLGVSLLART